MYYGTDTRAAGILVGVALSLVWIPWRLPTKLPRRQRTALNMGGIAGLAALIVILVGMDEFSTLLDRGGFLLTSLVTAVVIGATVHPSGVLGKLLENPVMKWIGTRSYGIYLWHWPIFMVTRPGVDVADRPYVAFAVRTALTFVIAEVSYRYVESPIRHKGFRQWVVDMRRAAGIQTVRGGSIVPSVHSCLSRSSSADSHGVPFFGVRDLSKSHPGRPRTSRCHHFWRRHPWRRRPPLQRPSRQRPSCHRRTTWLYQ